MKIAVVFDQMIFGGIERVGISHIKLLKQLGHSVDAYVLTKKTEPIIDELKDICDVHIIPFNRFLCSSTYWNATRRYKGGFLLLPLFIVMSSFFQFMVKPFKMVHKKYDLAIAFSGHFNDLTFVANNFIKADKKAAWVHGALYQYVLTSQGFEYSYKKIKNLVVLVDDCQEEVLAYHKNDKFNFNIKKVYNPVEMNDIAINLEEVKKIKERCGSSFLLMVSRFLYPHKDHYTVLSALKILKEKYNHILNLVFVGDGPELNKVKNFANKLGISDQVFFEGSKSNVRDYYACAKMLVHASVAGEGLPTVIIEAMNLNVPVVATDSKVGPKEIIGNDEFGMLCRVKDPEDMAKKIYEMDNEENLCKYRKLGFNRSKDFSNEKIKLSIIDFLNDLK